MGKILNIAWNDVRIQFSYPSHWVFFLVLPLVFTAVLGGALAGGGGDGEDLIPLLVVDEDESSLSLALVDAFEQSDVLQPVLSGPDEANQAFDEEEAPALVTIPEGLGERLAAGESVELDLRTVSDDSRVVAVEQALQAAASRVEQHVTVAHLSVNEAEALRPFETTAGREAYFREGLKMAQAAAQDGGMRVEMSRAPEVNAQIASGFEQSSPGELVTWVLITLLGASELLVSERLGGTLRRLFVTPAAKAQVLAGKIFGQLTLGIVQMALLIGFGAFVFNVDWGRSLAALAAVALAFALAAVALGVALGTFVRTRKQASGLTILFSMLMAALGGAWWPLEITPQSYQTAVKVLPSTWAMLGFQDVIVRGQRLDGVLLEAGVLLGFAAVFFALGVWRFRYE
jgi:ABC-2 type transport system permease protein